MIKLLRPCLVLWILGIAVMWVLRALLQLEVETVSFRVAAGFWFVGGAGYTGLGVMALLAGQRGTGSG
jgi:hypothetical protein